MLPKELCQQILNNGLKSHCSDEILKVILEKIGGHPFLLKQINIIMKNTKYHKEWKDILNELNQLVLKPFENRITFYNRLFENHLKVIPDLINIIKWIDNKYIEFSLLKSLVGFGGIDELEKRAFFNIKNGTYFKFKSQELKDNFNEIIESCIEHVSKQGDIYEFIKRQDNEDFIQDKWTLLFHFTKRPLN